MALMAGGFATGLGIGSATAPKDERTELHAMYWGGLLGLAAALAGEYYFADEDELSRLQLRNDKMQAEMELLKNANTVLLKSGQGYFKGTAGEEYFQGGKAKWRLYQIDRWTKDGPNRLYHLDRMVELQPEGEK